MSTSGLDKSATAAAERREHALLCKEVVKMMPSWHRFSVDKRGTVHIREVSKPHWRGKAAPSRKSASSAAQAEKPTRRVSPSRAQRSAAGRAEGAPPLTSEEARQQARAEELTLRVANNGSGYFGVNHQSRKPKPYIAQVSRGGKMVHLGSFVTAEEAALCIARSPEGQAAAAEAAERAAAPPPLTSEEARQQAQAEGLTLRVAESKTGYLGVAHKPGRPKPYQAELRRGGKKVTLGSFVTAEEAALCIARTPEGQAAAQWAAAAPVPLTSEEARQQAQAEGLVLRVADNKTGYFGVCISKPGQPKPYQAQVWRGGKYAHLASFVTAEEAALCVARSPEGQAAAEKVAAAPPLTSKEAQQQARDIIIRAVALDIIYGAAGAATAELSAEVAAEVMAGIAMGL
eukprot:scaffold66583_cov64-Phaeocystis_antarctica.AAC.3